MSRPRNPVPTLIDPKIGESPQSVTTLHTNYSPLTSTTLVDPKIGFKPPQQQGHSQLYTGHNQGQNLGFNSALARPAPPVSHSNRPNAPAYGFCDPAIQTHQGSSTQTFPPFNQQNNKEELPKVTPISQDLQNLIKRNTHSISTVFFHQLNINQRGELKSQHDVKWRSPNHVSTPFSSRNMAMGNNQNKWDVIKQSLMTLSNNCVKNSHQQCKSAMRNAISQYDTGIQSKTDFGTLNNTEISATLPTTIPTIVSYALMLPTLLAEPIPFLKRNENMTIYLTKNLVCSLMANAFFCTLEEKPGMDDINFYRLFNTAAKGGAKAEKLKCIINYFQQMRNRSSNQNMGQEIISFERRCLTPNQNWSQSFVRLVTVKVENNRKIEEAHGSLKVDFANKRVGGGVLNEGAVMEEILFAVCPELIISRLFTEALEDNEVLIITGTEQFSKYEGYSQSFQYKGPVTRSSMPMDNLGRIKNPVAVVDALHFKAHEVESQYQQNNIDREIHKAYVGFMIPNGDKNIPVATGNWGCGAFNGDPELKFLIQWLAASQAGRVSIVYHTIGNASQSQSIQSIASFLQQRNTSVGTLYKMVIAYKTKRTKFPSIFNYVKTTISKTK